MHGYSVPHEVEQVFFFSLMITQRSAEGSLAGARDKGGIHTMNACVDFNFICLFLYEHVSFQQKKREEKKQNWLV